MTYSLGRRPGALGLLIAFALCGCTQDDKPDDRGNADGLGCVATSQSNLDYSVPRTVAQARREGFATTARNAAVMFLAEDEDDGLELGPSVRQSYVSVVEEFAVLNQDDQTMKVLVTERLLRGVWAVTGVRTCAR